MDFKRLSCVLCASLAALLCEAAGAVTTLPAADTAKNLLESLEVTLTTVEDTPSTARELLLSPTLEEKYAYFPAADDYDAVLIQCEDMVNLRSRPVDGDVLRMLRNGRVAHLTGEKDGWYRVVYRDTIGYICADYCRPVYYADYADALSAASEQEHLVDLALDWLGVRYRYGGNSLSGTDCSGFTMSVFSQLGYDLPHSAEGQFYGFPSVSAEERAAGDLVFFSTGGNYIGHVGIYLGDGQFIHASTSQGVRIDSVYDEYYGPRYRGACRVLGG